MSRIMIGAALLTLAAYGGSADARRLTAEQEARIKLAGAPVGCVPLAGIRETRVRDDRTIDFYMRGRTVYRNTLPSSCPGLGMQESFSYKTSLSQLCSVDIITVLHSGPAMSGASCGLGKFQPISGAPK